MPLAYIINKKNTTLISVFSAFFEVVILMLSFIVIFIINSWQSGFNMSLLAKYSKHIIRSLCCVSLLFMLSCIYRFEMG